MELLSSPFARDEASSLGRRNLCASVVTVLSLAEEECDLMEDKVTVNACSRSQTEYIIFDLDINMCALNLRPPVRKFNSACKWGCKCRDHVHIPCAIPATKFVLQRLHADTIRAWLV